MKKKNERFLERLAIQIVFAAFLGFLGAGITIGFIELLELVHRFLWDDIPGKIDIDMKIYTLAMLSFGGLLVGLCHKYIGPYPEGLLEATKKFRKTGEFDYRHIPGAVVASLAALGFGASLGPEAALIALVGGLGTLIAKKLATSHILLEEATHIGLSVSFGAIFGSVAGAAFHPSTQKSTKLSYKEKILVYLPGVISALCAIFIVKIVSTGGYFEYDFLPYDFNLSDIVHVLPVAGVAIIAGLVFVLVKRSMTSLIKQSKASPLIIAVAGGFIVGLAAMYSSLVIFSGHEGVQTLIYNYGNDTTSFLLSIGLIKALAAAVLLSTYWKGGQFFPLIFTGAAIGLGVSQTIDGANPMVALAAGIGAVLTTVVPRPVVVILLLLLVVPLDLLLFSVAGVLIAVAATKIKFVSELVADS